MTKAVFFDLYQTLVGYEPPREEVHAGALKDMGISAKPEIFRRPIVVADEYIYREIARSPFSKRPDKERQAIFLEYEKILLKEAKLTIDEKLLPELLGKMQKIKTRLVAFEEVIPALTELAEKGLLLGLISNVDRDITSLLDELKLSPLLKVVVTSLHAGATKPDIRIFQEALRLAGTAASESIYVGDQYQIDVLGAEKAGMKGIFLDRGGYYPEIKSSPRIRNLSQVADYL